MRRCSILALAAALAALSGGCAVGARRSVVKPLAADEPLVESANVLLATHPIGPHEKIRVTPLRVTAEVSISLVQVNGNVPLHYHAAREETVIILRGRGENLLADFPGPDQRPKARPAGPGSVMFVPRGHVHGFRKLGEHPTAAISIFSPPFDDKDRIPVARR